MEINYLKEFVALSRSCNYFETAEELFISQSSLSRHIKSLEETLGVPLFDRTTRRVSLSKYGEAFLPYAQKIVALQDEYLADLSEQLEAVENTLSLGTIPVMAHYNITEQLASFQAAYPKFTIQIMEGDTLLLLEKLDEGSIDFAYVRCSDQLPDKYIDKAITRDTMIAILPTDHPLAKKRSVRVEQLAGESFLLLGEDTLMYSICVDACRHAGFRPKVVFTCKRGDNLIDLVSKGMGVSMLMKRPAMNMMNPYVTAVDIEPEISTTIDLIYLKDKKMNKAMRTFLDFKTDKWDRC